tara:strand:+ start:361 stop:855 length:495 start_codon:yes stop_codon:yes gene_type:complete
MGLTITAYKKARLIDVPAPNLPKVVIETGNSNCLQGDNLEADQIYHFEESLSISLTYNDFCALRNKLARIAGYPAAKTKRSGSEHSISAWQAWDGGDKNGTLAALINFEDSESEIGNATCRKTLADLKAVANDGCELNTENKAQVATLIELFTMAADGGFVKFH